MMNDRFDAQLREHLLGIADTKPDDGQLARVVGAVSHTSQRQPLVARLTWNPGRVGPFRTRTLQLGLVVVALVGAMVAAAIYVGSHPARSTVFEGWWTSTDPGDGSKQTLVIGAGNTPQIQFVDRLATGAACRDDAVKVFFAEGTGTVTGDELVATYPDGGGCGLRVVGVGPMTFTYQASTDTLLDADNLAWQRTDGTGPVPTRGPVASPSATPASSPEPRACLDLEPGQAYGVGVGSRFVTMNVPAAPNVPWGGLNDRFRLMSSCQNSELAVTIDVSIVDQVMNDACRDSTGDPVTSWDDAVTRFEAQLGHTTEPVAGAPATINGYRVRTYAVSESPACPDGLELWNRSLVFSTGAIVYLVDVDGVTFGIKVESSDPLTAAQLADVDAIVASMRVDPAPAVDPTGAAAGCIQFNTAGSYVGRVHSMLVAASVPATPDQPWRGDDPTFGLGRATCDINAGASLFFSAAQVDTVYGDACHWADAAVTVETFDDVVSALSKEAGVTMVGPVDTTVGANPAVRFEVTVPNGFDKSGCDADPLPILMLWNSTTIVPSIPLEVYVVDTPDGVLGVVASYGNGFNQADRSVVASILASLQIGS